MVTQARLKELLHYNPETGMFVWKCNRGGRAKKGSIAGAVNGGGYKQICIDYVTYKAHRLALLYMTGDLPPDDTDHRNGVRNDNRFENLRPASRLLNQQNQQKAHSNNQQGLLGVGKEGDRYRARIRHEGKQIYLGAFDTMAEAGDAYQAAKRKLHIGATLAVA